MRFLIGSPPGFSNKICHPCSGVRSSGDFSKEGISPALISDDFPLPEDPMIAKNLDALSLSRNFLTWLSLPKNRLASFESKLLNPGKGLA